MCRFSIKACAVAALMGVGAVAGEASAQQSYPIVCHGGGAMQFVADVTGSSELRFQPGTQGASAARPGRGECAWLDRGWRSGEPTVLAVSSNADWSRYLFNGMVTDDVFYAHVYNDGAGRMIVTRVGP